MILDSLPERPLLEPELDGLREDDRVDTAVPFAAYGTGGHEFILQFALISGSEMLAFHFDPFDECWEFLGAADSFGELEVFLAAARGDPV